MRNYRFNDNLKFERRCTINLGNVFTTQHVSETDARVAATGILDKLASWRREDNPAHRGNNPRALVSDRAILVGLLLLASEHYPLSMTALADLFMLGLTLESRTLLGLASVADAPSSQANEHKRWYGGTVTAYHRMLAVMDPFPQMPDVAHTATEIIASLDVHDVDREKAMRARLNEFTDAFLQMTFQQQPQHLRQATARIDIAIGQTFIASPARTGYTARSLARPADCEARLDPQSVQRRVVDIFAGGHAETGHPVNYGHESVAPTTRPADRERGLTRSWGWSANIAVRVDSTHPEEVRFPPLAVSATLSLPTIGVADEAVSLMRSALNTGLRAGIVDVEPGYFASTLVERLHKPTVALGFTPSTDYRRDRLGVQGGTAGAEFIEGKAYCPGMPQELKDASKDFVNDRIDKATLRARIQDRVPFVLETSLSPDGSGQVTMVCRVDHDQTVAPSLCTQRPVTISPEDAVRLRQGFTYKSSKWESFQRHARHCAEALNAGLSTPGWEDVASASRRRVRGFAAGQVVLTMLLTNYNLRQIDAFLINSRTPDRQGQRNRIWG
jgi:hypothetical protein